MTKGELRTRIGERLVEARAELDAIEQAVQTDAPIDDLMALADVTGRDEGGSAVLDVIFLFGAYTHAS